MSRTRLWPSTRPSLPERVDHRTIAADAPDHREPRNLSRLLRLGHERRGKQTESEKDHERDQPTGTSAGWLAGSLADECCSEELAALVEHVLLDDLVRPHQQRLRDG